MEEPPDPGGSVPPAASFITVVSNESGMETDGSWVSAKNLKRSRPSKVCRHCNKRRRKRNSNSEPKEIDCVCDHVEIIPEKTTVVNEIMKPDSIIPKPNLTLPNNESLIGKTTDTHPRPPPIGRTLYESTDVAPFIVHVQREQTNPDDNTSLHPIAFGKFLQKQCFNNIVNGSLKRIGRNRISLAFTHFENANAFLVHDSLIKNKLKAFVPTFNLTRMGLVRGVPAEWTPEEVMENTTVPLGCGKILKIRRLNYKTTVAGTPTWKPSQTVVVTFDGQVLPKRIYICYNALPVELYTYPTIQCYSCCRFGHTKVQCRSKPRCYKCGQAHTADSCNIVEQGASCCLCSGSHFATSKSCPEHDRQRKIKQSMAESCISYSEASKYYPPVSKSYAEILSTNQSIPTERKISSTKFSSSSTTSYKKSVASKPRQARQPSVGYDRATHQEIIKEYDMPAPPNGCAISSNTNNNNQTLTEIIIMLISTLSQSNLLKPNHAAPILDLLKNIMNIHNGYTPSNDEQL